MAAARRQRQREARWRHTAWHKVNDDDGDGVMDDDINNNCDGTMSDDDESCNIY